MTIPQRSWLTLNMTSDQPDPNGRWPRELEVFVATSNVLKCCNSYWCNFYDGTLGMTNPPKTTGYVVFLWVLWMFCCLSIYRKKKKNIGTSMFHEGLGSERKISNIWPLQDPQVSIRERFWVWLTVKKLPESCTGAKTSLWMRMITCSCFFLPLCAWSTQNCKT